MGGYFSERMGVLRPAQGLVTDSVPDEVRNAARIALEPLDPDEHGFWEELWDFLIDELLLSPDGRDPIDGEWAANNLLDTCEWNVFFDACEVIYRFLKMAERHRPKPRVTGDEFANLLNIALRRHFVGYTLDESGQIKLVGATAGEAVMAEASALLRNSKLEGPDRFFQRAMEAFGRRPQPDYEGAVAAAVSAVEGVARIALGTKDTLGKAISKIGVAKDLNPALVGTIEKLYGYASDEGGRHGLVGESKVDRAVAEFCLHQSAAAIVLIARLYGFEVVEG